MVKFYETLDSEGRVTIRLNRRNGRILARWRCDMPNQTRYQFVRERKAVLDGYGELCYTAIQCALYANGMSDFRLPFTRQSLDTAISNSERLRARKTPAPTFGGKYV